jgi:hypothetical protein
MSVTNIAGHWDCIATDSHGSKHYFAWELTADQERLAGRFDQNIDYRFAFITEGSFRSNRVTMTVDYINQRFLLRGEARDRKFTGSWRRADDGDHGNFEAVRTSPPPVLPNLEQAVPLYEWVRPADNARRYSIEPEITEPGWERAARPLGRVWTKQQNE